MVDLFLLLISSLILIYINEVRHCFLFSPFLFACSAFTRPYLPYIVGSENHPSWQRQISRCTTTRRLAPQLAPPSHQSRLVKLPPSEDGSLNFSLQSTKRKAVLLRRRMPPMPISTRFPHLSAHGTGVPMSRTGWQTPGLSPIGKLVSLRRPASYMDS
jgi:hypothetical protein